MAEFDDRKTVADISTTDVMERGLEDGAVKKVLDNSGGC
jgi:hypothetical protein